MPMNISIFNWIAYRKLFLLSFVCVLNEIYYFLLSDFLYIF